MIDTILLPKKRFVIIGTGNFGRILIERLLAFGVPTTSMTVCDIEEERGARLRQNAMYSSPPWMIQISVQPI